MIGRAARTVTTTLIVRIQLTTNCRAEKVVDLRDHVTLAPKSRSFVFNPSKCVKQLISIVRHRRESRVVEPAGECQLVIIERLTESA
jgi:hypothetical protein